MEMKYTYPNTVNHIVSDYICLWKFISKTLGLVAYFSCTIRREMPLCPAPSGGRLPLEMKYTDCIFLWEFLSKTLGLVAYFALHLQEGDALWKWNILIQLPWVMYFQSIYGYGILSPKP